MIKTTGIFFISSNFKGIQNSLERLKIFNYLKENISCNGVLFLQITHSSSKNEIKEKDKFKMELFFSHEKTNLCGVAIGYNGKRSFKL